MKTLTLRGVLANADEYQRPIIRAVVKRIGKESIEDVINHGAASGFAGFTYSSDTVPFFRKHRRGIMRWLVAFADDLGEDVFDMVKSFRCLHNESPQNIAQVLYCGDANDETIIIENGLAWFALEETCRLFED